MRRYLLYLLLLALILAVVGVVANSRRTGHDTIGNHPAASTSPATDSLNPGMAPSPGNATDTAPVEGDSDDQPAETMAALNTPTIQDLANQQREELDPHTDGWESEALAQDALSVLDRMLKHLRQQPAARREELAPMLAADFACTPLRPPGLIESYRDETVVVHRADPTALGDAAAAHRGVSGLVTALDDLYEPFRPADRLHAKVKVYGLVTRGDIAATKALVEMSTESPGGRSQSEATWECLWSKAGGRPLRLSAIRVRDYEEVTTRAEHGVWFADCTQSVLGKNASFQNQLGYGLDHWLRRIERTHRMHVFMASGLAVGDVNGDGREDLYVCQPGGLPNRLYQQNEDGSATDVSERAGVDWLDSTSSALLVDLDNDGDPDLVAATLTGLLVMENDSTGQFRLRAVLSTSGDEMQSLSAADYDVDGDLDLYICLNFAKVGPGTQPERTFVYHDANDGAPNHLFRNDLAGSDQWQFTDVTRSTGLDVDNRRHSLAASWEDYDNDGDPDLYVANDYGRNCLYRNDGGKFVNVAASAGVVDFGSGMSASWGDYNRDGMMDLYVSNMFSSAGGRVTGQPGFRPGADETTRRVLRRFAKGNSLFVNQGDGTFREVSHELAVEIARWAWSSIFIDVNNNGWDDIFVANGYITADDTVDL